MATILQKTDKDLRRFFETRYATLNANGMIPDEQVPGQVTDVLNYETKNDFPAVGDPDKYYRSDASGKTYKWDAEASEYVEVVIPVVAVTSVAGRAGDVVLAKADVGLGSVVNTGDSATPIANGTTKFTTGGAYTELAKKMDISSTVGQASTAYVNRGGVKRVAFKPSAFGMPADALLKSVTLYFTDGSNPSAAAAAPFAKILDPADTSTALGVSAGIPQIQSGRAMKITFFTPIRLAEKEYWLEFFNPAPDSLQYTGLLLFATSQTATDLYVKADGNGIERTGWRPTFGGAEWVFDWQTITTALAAAANNQQEPVGE